MPLAAHAAVLVCLLVAVAGWVGTSTSWTSDEGSTIHQVRTLDAGSWRLAHPLPAADPVGANYPLDGADWGSRGVAPLARHPLYPAMLLPLYQLAGIAGLVGASLAGTVLAAVAAGHLAGLVAARLQRPTFWLVGLASPAFFYGFVVMAHTLAAAAGLGAAASILAAGRATARVRRWSLVGAACGLVAVCVALRTEGVFLGPALAAGVVVAGTGLGYSRLARATVGSALVASAAAALLADRLWVRSILGTIEPRPTDLFASAGHRTSWLGDRLNGLRVSMLRPSIDTSAGAVLLLSVSALCLVLAVVILRRARSDQALAAKLVAVAGVAAGLRLVVAPADAVTGLLVAFPTLWAGLALLPAKSARSPVPCFLLVSGGVAGTGVATTIYREGGGLEWGGRYFLVAALLLTPVAVAGLVHVAERLVDGRERVLAVAGLGLLTAALSWQGVTTIDDFHRDGRLETELVNRAAASLGDEHPVIVATGPAMARVHYTGFSEQRWLGATVDRPYDASLVQRLRSAGIAHFVFLTTEPDRQLALLDGAIRSTELPGAGRLRVIRVDL
jgi:hypothetical protein